MNWYKPQNSSFGSQVSYSRPSFSAPFSLESTGSKGMDPVIGAAAIQGGSQLVSSVIGGKGNNRATQAQERAQREALDFQKAESAKEEARYKENKLAQIMAWNDYNRQMEPVRQRRAKLLGIDYRAPAQIPPEGWTAPVQPGAVPRSLGQLAGGSQIQGGNVAPALQDLEAGEARTLGGMARGPRGPWGMWAQQ